MTFDVAADAYADFMGRFAPPPLTVHVDIATFDQWWAATARRP